jgi:tetratricopeptide (TPR) repeat protein
MSPRNNEPPRRPKRPGQGGSGGEGPRRTRGRDEQRRGGERSRADDRRSLTSVPTGDLPRWVRDEITRTAPKDRREPAIVHLSRAVSDFADERFGAAFEQLKRAKDLAPQAATIRELLGLSAYHLGRWDEALRELRTFRRLTGETTQMPVELDCLRALDRPEDIEKTWRKFQELEPAKAIEDEARVVYASSLLDRGLLTEAWKAIKPGRLVENPSPSTLRRWYVAARVALAAADNETAQKIVAALASADSDFPGLADLQAELSP